MSEDDLGENGSGDETTKTAAMGAGMGFADEAAYEAGLDAWAPPLRSADVMRQETAALGGEAPEALRSAIAERLGLLAIRRLSYRATFEAERGEIALSGVVEADLDQECAVSLEPAPADINEPLARRWLPPARYAERIAALMLDPDESDKADPEALPRGALGLDLSVEGADELEPMAEMLRIGPLLVETLSLALHPYPRAPGVVFEGARAAPDGVEPLDEESVKPFAGLAALKARLEKGGSEEE